MPRRASATPTTLRLNDLASSIEAIEGKAAVVVFRDCFMNTLETAYQLRHAAEFMMASQSVVPIAGVWPWAGFMTALMPSAASADVGRALAVQLAHFLDEPVEPRSVRRRAVFAHRSRRGRGHRRAAESAGRRARCRARRPEALGGVRDARSKAPRVGYPDDRSNPGDPALLDVPTMCDELRALDPDPVAGPARALGEAVRDAAGALASRRRKGRIRGPASTISR